MESIRMLFGKPVKPRADAVEVIPVTLSELEAKRRDVESTTAKVKEFTQRLADEQAPLKALRRGLGERVHLGEDGFEVLEEIRLIEDRLHGLESAMSLAREKRDEAEEAFTTAKKHGETAKYVQALDLLKRDALKVDEALLALEEASGAARERLLDVLALGAGQRQHFIITAKLELQRFAEIAISPITGKPKPPGRLMAFTTWSQAIPPIDEILLARATAKQKPSAA